MALKLEEFWFRSSTRLRAGGYWFEEKWRQLVGGKPRGRKRSKSGSSRGRPRSANRRKGKRSGLRTGQRVGIAVAALIALVISLFILVPLPLVPCSVSPAKECPPPDEAIDLVPEDALLYAHLVRDPETGQFARAGDIGRHIPDFSAVSEAILSGFAEGPASAIQAGRDVLPWTDREFALVALPPVSGDPSGPQSETLFIAGTSSGGKDQGRRASDLLQSASGGPPLSRSEIDGTEVVEYPRDLALARVGDFQLFGASSAVKRAVEVGAGTSPSLSAGVSPRGDLPEQRFADIFVSRAGAKSLFGSEGGSLGQLGAFVDYSATEGFAIGLSAEDGNVVIDIVSDLSKAKLEASPNALTTVPAFSPDLAGLAPKDSLAYFGVGRVGPTLRGVLDTALGGELASSFDQFGRQLGRGPDPDPLSELLPALGGQAGLVLEPTAGPPEATLLVDQVDQKQATEALARLQQPMAKTLSDGSRGVARFERSTRDGVRVYSLEGPSRLGLAYAVTDGHLIVSSTREGVTRIIEGGGGLTETAAWRGAIADLSKSPSALLFLDLQELSRLAELAGLAEDPLYAALSDDISNIDSLGVSIDAEPERLDSKVVLDLR